MGDRPKLAVLDDPLAARRAPEPVEPLATRVADGQEAGQAEPPGQTVMLPGGDPYHGAPKVSVNMRATQPLWVRLRQLARELEAAGFDASATELTEALWHFHTPEDADAAKELLRRYRMARLGPTPARPI